MSTPVVYQYQRALDAFRREGREPPLLKRMSELISLLDLTATLNSNLSARDIEDLLAKRGIFVSYESIRLWCIKFGPQYAGRLKRQHRGFGDTFFVDEVFVKIRGKQHYLWRAVDQDGDVVDVFLQTRRDAERRGGRQALL